MKKQVLIIGGGLAGLSLAFKLEQDGLDYHLIEARDRFGGRIKNLKVERGDSTAHFDTGPAWFWPGQPRIADLIKTFNLTIFEQYSTGDLTFEDENGHIERGIGFASMEGSYRLEGGLGQLINCLRKQLSSYRVELEKRAKHLSFSDGMIATQIESSDGAMTTMTSQQVVLALPPRLAAETIQFGNDVSKEALETMREIPTWMAGHAKILAIYETPFWRDAGFSGDVISRKGPMVEIHDASPNEGGPYALFGFVGVSAMERKAQSKVLIEQAQSQLARLFGPEANTPIEIILQDWAFEPETATQLDHIALNHHPVHGPSHILSNLWEGNLILGSSEVAQQFGGYLEGALEVSEIIAQQLARKK